MSLPFNKIYMGIEQQCLSQVLMGKDKEKAVMEKTDKKHAQREHGSISMLKKYKFFYFFKIRLLTFLIVKLIIFLVVRMKLLIYAIVLRKWNFQNHVLFHRHFQ